MALVEIGLRVTNRPGELARVARILARERINLAAISVDSSGKNGHVRIIVNRPERALGLLTAAGFPVESRELIAVHLSDETGSFLRILDLLTEARLNVTSVAILVAREGSQSLIALSTSDIRKARQVLEKAGVLSETAELLTSNADLLAYAPSIPSESVGLLM
ncbi:MAG: ACT domain-containing protein [Thermoplasmata archaeon]|nr:ACT domain-containing protein [Thermoplasmata archaeon]MCI4359737.1 ACT domain-containing protein [Thermoplasmata archaeon]